MREVRPGFESLEELDAYLGTSQSLSGCVFHGLDLRGHTLKLTRTALIDALFLGCELEPEALVHAQASGALLLPPFPGLPYKAYRASLYTVEELYEGYETSVPDAYKNTLDGRVYQHYVSAGKEGATSIRDTLARRLHDHAISDALEDVVSGRKVVAIMGGHSIKRCDPQFLSVAKIARELTRKGFLLVSGGGPGAMEATHLGAWFAGHEMAQLADAVGILKKAPSYEPIDDWLDAAFEVRLRYPLSDAAAEKAMSVGIPTWLYGNEPPNVFAILVAKYFENSIREECLLAIAKYGVIFAPGSAGTIQEIFQDAAQHYYLSFGGPSPMIFFGEDYWKWRMPVYPLLTQLAAGQEYAKRLQISDDVERIVEEVVKYAAKGH